MPTCLSCLWGVPGRVATFLTTILIRMNRIKANGLSQRDIFIETDV